MHKPDIIHACDLDCLYPAIISRIFKKFQFVYMVYDYYANNIVTGKFEILQKRIRFIVDKIEKYGISHSHLLILADESRYAEVKGAKIKNLIYIYNSPEDEYSTDPLINISDNSNPLIILYIGIIQRNRGITDMISAIKDMDDVRLITAGPLVHKEVIESEFGNIQYLGWIPTYKEVILWTQKANILFRFSDPSHPKTKYESPNKLFEAMMCAKPIIVSGASAMATIVQKENCGIVIKYGNIDEIRNAILKLKNEKSYYQLLANNGRKAYEEKYNWKIMEERLLSAYQQLNEN